MKYNRAYYSDNSTGFESGIYIEYSLCQLKVYICDIHDAVTIPINACSSFSNRVKCF